MAQQLRRLTPGQSLNGAPPLPIRNRGPREERLRGLRSLEASGSTEDEMRRYANAFVITDPYEQSRIDQWRERPGEYVAETLYNLPKNVWSTAKSIPALINLGKGVQSELAGGAVSTLGDLLGKDIENTPISRMFGPGLGLSFGRENIDAIRELPASLREHYGQYLRPEGRATIIHDDPLGVLGDVSVGIGTAAKAPTIVRGLNTLSKKPVLAGSVVGLGTFATTQDFTNAWRAAISAYGMAKARKFFDAKMAEMQLTKVKRADDLTAAQVKQTWKDAVQEAKNLNARDAYLARKAADEATDIKIHQANLDKIDNASSVTAMENAAKQAQLHVENATNINPSERATILAAVEESLTNRRLALSRQQALGEGRESARIMDQQQARLAKEAADEAARIREVELFPFGREALPPTATETSARLNEGMRTSVSQRFQQPRIETPITPSHRSASNPARAALDEMIETRVAPLESNEIAIITKRFRELSRKAILTTEESLEFKELMSRVRRSASEVGLTYPAGGSPRSAVRDLNTREIMLDPAPRTRGTR